MYEMVKELLVSSFGVIEDRVTPEASLKDLELDSLDVVELSLVLEKELRIKVTDDDLMSVDRFELLIELLEDRVAKAL